MPSNPEALSSTVQIGGGKKKRKEEGMENEKEKQFSLFIKVHVRKMVNARGNECNRG
jgi:phage-related protein